MEDDLWDRLKFGSNDQLATRLASVPNRPWNPWAKRPAGLDKHRRPNDPPYQKTQKLSLATSGNSFTFRSQPPRPLATIPLLRFLPKPVAGGGPSVFATTAATTWLAKSVCIFAWSPVSYRSPSAIEIARGHTNVVGPTTGSRLGRNSNSMAVAGSRLKPTPG